MERLSFDNKANEAVHFEFNAGEYQTEVEVYIGGFFLCSVDIKDISYEAKQELFN